MCGERTPGRFSPRYEQGSTAERRRTPKLHGEDTNGLQRSRRTPRDEPPSLVQFDTATPQERTQRVYVRGLEHREDLLAIDYRPKTDRLLGLSDRGRIYRINPETGQARSHPRNAIQSNLGRRVAGFDVNPMADRLRVQTLAGRNFRINPDNPNGPEGTIEDGRLSYADGDRFAGRPPRIAAGAYTDNVDGSTTSRLYGIDARLDTFALQDPVDAGVLTTVGGLGLDTVPGETAFDVSGDTGAAFAVVSGFRGPSRLARIDLATGQATPVGTIGAGGRYEGLAILPRDYANGATRSNDSRKPTFRFATFNASLNRLSEGELNEQLATGDNPQIQAVAETIQRARPDVLLVNEFDFDDDGRTARAWRRSASRTTTSP